MDNPKSVPPKSGETVSRKFWFVAGVVFALVLQTLYLAIDIALNGDWLSELKFTWGRVLTTRHGVALLYYKSIPLCLAAIGGVALFVGVVSAIRGDKD